MGLVPPPLPMSKEDFEKAGCRDLAFDKWFRYEANPFGFLLWLMDKCRRKKVPNVFEKHIK